MPEIFLLSTKIYYNMSQAALKMRSPSGLKQLSVCRNMQVFLAVVYDTIQIYDTELKSPVNSIKLASTPRSARLSLCGKYFFVHDSNNLIQIYDTRSCVVMQQIGVAPVATKNIRFSNNSQKLVFGSTQMICLWNIRRCELDVRTEHWKNINCYDVNDNGTQFALGTYNGKIFVIDFIEVGRCTQVQISRHKTCIVSICCHKNQIISASHDGYFLISTLHNDGNGERTIVYNQMKMKSIPKQMESIGDRFYMYSHQGLTWFNKYKGLEGFVDGKLYRVLMSEEGKVYYVSVYMGEMEWWPAQAFKTTSQMEKQKAEKIHLYLQQRQKEQARKQGHSQNKFIYKVTYRQ